MIEGFFGVVVRLEREAAARAAVFRFEAVVLAVVLFADTGDAVDFFRAARFAPDLRWRDGAVFERLTDFFARDDLPPGVRFATFPPVARSCGDDQKKRAALTPLATGHSGTEPVLPANVGRVLAACTDRMLPFGKLFNHLLVERRNIVGLS
jgi:hypothetical protein